MVVVWEKSIAVLVAVTVAPATAAPDGSRTVPFSDPRVCWAKAADAVKIRADRKRIELANLLRKRWFINLFAACWAIVDGTFSLF